MNYQNIFNRDFFTTPRPVIERMTMGEDLTDAVILEPSAGSGNIVKYCKEMGARYVMACEINDTLRAALYSECQVIAPDFLTVTPQQVSACRYIIMNPPFTYVEKHILHAWEIAPAGCTVIALCPSSRFSYAVGQAKELLEKIDLYGIREDLGDVFNTAQADRKTGAEITLVKLYKPGEGASEFDGYIFEDACETIDTGNGEAGLIKYDAVRDMVARYISAMRRYDEVEKLSAEINADIEGFSACRIRFGAHGKDHQGHDLSNITRERFRKELQHAAWKWVFDKLDMKRFYTSVMQEKINYFVEQSQAMPFTMRNIYQVVNTLIQNIGNIMNECVVRAFDTICELSAENSTAGEKWKTNSNYMVNRRFIVDFISTELYTPYVYKNGVRVCSPAHLRYTSCIYSRRQQQMNDLYKALSYVAGKEINAHSWNPFESDIIHNVHDFGKWTEFGWFRVRFYKKGTMHFEFLDEKVWQRFNQIAAKAKGWKIGSRTK